MNPRPKKLLSDQDLDWTAVVANNRMNRSRAAIGVNSYAQDIGFDPILFLQERATEQRVRWLDLCCGEGNALIQAATILPERRNPFQLIGIDLVDHFSVLPEEVVPHVELIQSSLRAWEVAGLFDLITIVHGLHYLGDKLGILAKYLPHLAPEGVFIGHLDLDNLLLEGVDNSSEYLLHFFQGERIAFDSHQHLLMVKGPRQLSLPYKYLGADIKAGPNYTGQEAVTSVYQVKPNHSPSPLH